MRTLVLGGLLVLALLAPGASAAGFSFLAGRHLEAWPEETGLAAFEMPLRVEEDGLLYAKLLATDGNVVHDGRRANGSVSAGTGWRLDLGLRDASGEARDLGTYVDGTPTPTVPVKAGDELTLLMTLRVPEDAARYGARQVSYVALAFRLDAADGTGGGSSGASMDQARAITLIVHFPEGTPSPIPPTPGDPTPATPDPEAPTPVEPTTPTSPTPVEPTPVDPTPSDPGPVGPIPTAQSGTVRVVVEQQALPLWFMLAALGLALAIVVVLGGVLVLLGQILRETRAGRTAARRVPIETTEPPADAAALAPALGER